MSGPREDRLRLLLGGQLRSVRLRAMVVIGLGTLPLAGLAAALADRLGGGTAAVAAGLAMLLAGFGMAVHRTRAYDPAWLARQLNSRSPDLEDSAGLLFGGGAGLAAPSGLAALQRERLHRRLAGLAWPELRPVIPTRALVWTWLVALTFAGAALYLPSPVALLAASTRGLFTPSAASASVLAEVALTALPPQYTGLDPMHLASADARVPSESSVRWRLRLEPKPSGVSLEFHDGSRLALAADGEDWSGERVIPVSVLYRVVVEGAPPLDGDPLHRIDAIPDRPPEVIVHRPEKTLNLLDEGQKTWDLYFEASDDYGLGPAELSISLAQGSGEQIKVTERKLVLDGGSDPKSRSYRKTLDLGELGFSKGDDLIVRLSVADNHVPQPNRTTSASFILRWPPPESKESEGMDGIVQKAMPANFRSERQIIIDSEAMVANRAGIPAAEFARKADGLGIDQKVLRLRFGQFLGEEFEGESEHAPPASPGPPAVSTGGEPAGTGASEALKLVPPDHDEPSPAARFGAEGNILAEFGHVHDKPGAATLLDPETKRILRQALGEMWQAELKLRQALPDEALPFEYRALDGIKQVQQAERIYLARSGLDLPQVDASRRLSGDRAGLADRTATAAAAQPEATPLPAAWQALQEGQAPDFVGLEAWTKDHATHVPDALGLLAAVDRLRHDAACATCRTDLEARLWALLPPPAAAVSAREAPDAAGSAYLDALAGSAP